MFRRPAQGQQIIGNARGPNILLARRIFCARIGEPLWQRAQAALRESGLRCDKREQQEGALIAGQNQGLYLMLAPIGSIVQPK